LTHLVRNTRFALAPSFVWKFVLSEEGDFGSVDAEDVGGEVDAALVAFLRLA
jgi:hypothetical protein